MSGHTQYTYMNRRFRGDKIIERSLTLTSVHIIIYSCTVLTFSSNLHCPKNNEHILNKNGKSQIKKINSPLTLETYNLPYYYSNI